MSNLLLLITNSSLLLVTSPVTGSIVFCTSTLFSTLINDLSPATVILFEIAFSVYDSTTHTN